MRPSLLVYLMLLGCTPEAEDTSPPADTDTDAELAAADLTWLATGEPAIAAPEIAWLDAGTPTVAPPSRTCPEGWVEDALEDGGHACYPWPTGARAECDAGEAHLPGTDTCAPIGASCPDGWPDDVSDDGTWFVATDGSGDGTRAAPFGTIAEALAAAAAGDTIQLGAGSFDGQIAVTSDVTLRGLCPSMTTLTWGAPDDEDGGVVTVDAAALTLRDLSIADSQTAGVVATDATLSLTGVVVSGVVSEGISARDSSVTLDDVLVDSVGPRPSDLTGGDPVFATGETTIVATGLTLSRSHRAGLWVENGATVDLSDLVVFGMEPQASDNGRGVAMRISGASGANVVRRAVVQGGHDYAFGGLGGDLTIEDAWISDVGGDLLDGAGAGAVLYQGTGTFRGAGITVIDSVQYAVRGSGLDGAAIGPFYVEDIVARGIVRDEGSTYGGGGVCIVESPDAQVSRVLVEDSDGDSLIIEEGTVATINDVRVRRSGLLGGYGAGLNVNASDVTLERAVIEDELFTGIIANGGSVDATDVYISGGGLTADEPAYGAGVVAWGGAAVTLRSTVIEDVWFVGLDIEEASSLSAYDTILSNVQPTTALPYGIGVNTYEVADVTLERVVLDGAYGSGLTGVDDTTFTLTDVRVSNIQSLVETGQYGVGLDNANGVTTLTRVAFTDVQGAGVYITGGEATLQDVLVSGVLPQSCLATLCPDNTEATGIFLGADADVSLAGVLVEDATVGLQVVGTATLANGVLRTNTVGIDDVNGDLTITSVTFDTNGADSATEAQPAPSVVW